MKNNSIRNDSSYSAKNNARENNLNSDSLAMEVHVAGVKSGKGKYDPEKVRRQRQDLFDNWEMGNKKASYAKQTYHF